MPTYTRETEFGPVSFSTSKGISKHELDKMVAEWTATTRAAQEAEPLPLDPQVLLSDPPPITLAGEGDSDRIMEPTHFDPNQLPERPPDQPYVPGKSSDSRAGGITVFGAAGAPTREYMEAATGRPVPRDPAEGPLFTDPVFMREVVGRSAGAAVAGTLPLLAGAIREAGTISDTSRASEIQDESRRKMMRRLFENNDTNLLLVGIEEDWKELTDIMGADADVSETKVEETFSFSIPEGASTDEIRDLVSKTSPSQFSADINTARVTGKELAASVKAHFDVTDFEASLLMAASDPLDTMLNVGWFIPSLDPFALAARAISKGGATAVKGVGLLRRLRHFKKIRDDIRLQSIADLELVEGTAKAKVADSKANLEKGLQETTAEIASELQASSQAPTSTPTVSQKVLAADDAVRTADMEAGLAGDQADLVRGGVDQTRAIAEGDLKAVGEAITQDVSRPLSDYLPEGVDAAPVDRSMPQSVMDAEQAFAQADQSQALTDAFAAEQAIEQGGRQAAAGTKAAHLSRDIRTAESRPVGDYPLTEGLPDEGIARSSTEAQQALEEAARRERLAALAEEKAQTAGEESISDGLEGSEYVQQVNQEKAAIRRREVPEGDAPEPLGDLERLAKPAEALDVDLDITARQAVSEADLRRASPERGPGHTAIVDYTIKHADQAVMLDYIQSLLDMGGSSRKLGAMVKGERQTWDKTAQLLVDEGHVIYDGPSGKMVSNTDSALAIADGILDAGRSATALEQLAVARAIDGIKNQMESIVKGLPGADTPVIGDRVYVDVEAAAAMDGLAVKYKRLHDAESTLGTRLSQALNERKRFISADVTVSDFLSKARLNKGKALTAWEISKVTSTVEKVDAKVAAANAHVDKTQAALGVAADRIKKLATGITKKKKGSEGRLLAEAELADAKGVSKGLKDTLRKGRKELKSAEADARRAARDLEAIRTREAKIKDLEEKAVEIQALNAESAAVKRGVAQSAAVAKQAASASRKASRELVAAEKSLAKEIARDEARAVRADNKAVREAKGEVKKQVLGDLRGFRDRAKAKATEAKQALHDAEMAARKAARDAKSKHAALKKEIDRANKEFERADTRDLRKAQREASTEVRAEHLAELRGTRAALKKGIRDGEARSSAAESHWKEKKRALDEAENTLGREIAKSEREISRLDGRLKREFDKEVNEVAKALASRDKNVKRLKKEVLSAKSAQRYVTGMKDRIYGEMGNGIVVSAVTTIGRGIALSTPLTTLGDLSFIGRQFAGGLLWGTLIEAKGLLPGHRSHGVPGSFAAKTAYESMLALVSPVAAREAALALQTGEAAVKANKAGIVVKTVEDIAVAGPQAGEEVLRHLSDLGFVKPDGVMAGIIRRSNNSIALAGNIVRRFVFDHYANIPGILPEELANIAHLINTISGATDIRGVKTPRVRGGILSKSDNLTAAWESFQNAYITTAGKVVIAPRLYLSQLKVPFVVAEGLTSKSAALRGAARDALMADFLVRYAAYGSLNYLAAKFYDGLSDNEAGARAWSATIIGSPHHGKIVMGGEQVSVDSGTSALWRYLIPAPSLDGVDLYSVEGITKWRETDFADYDYSRVKWMGDRYIEKGARGLKYKFHPGLGSLYDIANSETFYGATKELKDYGQEWEYWFDRVAAPILGSYIPFPLQTAAKNIAGALADDTSDSIFLGSGDKHLVESPPLFAPIKIGADFLGFTSGKSRYDIEKERASRRGGGSAFPGGGLGDGLGGGDLGDGL